MTGPSSFGWKPFDADLAVGPARAGSLVAWDYKPWRLITVSPAPPRPEVSAVAGDCFYFLLRPPGLTSSPFERTDHDQSLYGNRLIVLHEHYGLCTHCGELTPCRSRDAARIAAEAAAEMDRYEYTGICPSCLDPVTDRQRSNSLPNMIYPGGPPVTFHTSRPTCAYAKRIYELRLAHNHLL